MSTSRNFPSITGSCLCSTVRYRLLTSPLYCYACHCADCQKSTGSAFSLYLNIEVFNIRILSDTAPIAIIREKKPGQLDRHVECPRCKAELWSNNMLGDAIADVRVGTLDFPSLMEPDVHIFIDSKLDWVVLPEGAKTTPKDYELKDFWPKSSLKRLDMCLEKTEEMKQKKEAAALAAVAAAVLQKESLAANQRSELETEVGETSGEGEKTPTAAEFGEKDLEDDEAFEERYKETEKALQERLEKLSLKLEEEEMTNKMEQTAVE
ncbi:hypothetical protein T440DRAFT_473197 [Plenodomus tracheiphilus IPT5]|uniref:CENP-V/GFA domain-containing protein n=1 Tax=Plenodomus tracheiphilus IPT5 TaxID=1408161 RepID=A0A6A7AN96_9PLEO|nr:hypothetical protein T440DRAFT_473197 [Plenodomus tracheiphilus IPT5]